jgi:serine/threonine-protein kinase
VTGEDEATATVDLQNAGFTVDSVDSATSDPSEDGVVLDESPSGGSHAADGSSVTITVGRYSGG